MISQFTPKLTAVKGIPDDREVAIQGICGVQRGVRIARVRGIADTIHVHVHCSWKVGNAVGYELPPTYCTKECVVHTGVIASQVSRDDQIGESPVMARDKGWVREKAGMDNYMSFLCVVKLMSRFLSVMVSSWP